MIYFFSLLQSGVVFLKSSVISMEYSFLMWYDLRYVDLKDAIIAKLVPNRGSNLITSFVRYIHCKFKALCNFFTLNLVTGRGLWWCSLYFNFVLAEYPYPLPKENSHIKMTGMLVILLGGVISIY